MVEECFSVAYVVCMIHSHLIMIPLNYYADSQKSLVMSCYCGFISEATVIYWNHPLFNSDSSLITFLSHSSC